MVLAYIRRYVRVLDLWMQEGLAITVSTGLVLCD